MEKHFVVTISREFGAEGHEIGKVLSERLGVKLYDKELLAKAAARNGLDASAVRSYDESVEKGLWNRIWESRMPERHRRIFSSSRKCRS